MGSALQNCLALALLCFVWTSMASWSLMGCLRRRRWPRWYHVALRRPRGAASRCISPMR